MALLEVENLNIQFRDDGTEAVHGISFSLNQGEIVGLVGESGSGKSVTAMAICGLLNREKAQITGSIRFDGENLLTCPEPALRARQGSAFSVVFQEPMTSLNPLMRIGPQVEESLRVHTDLPRSARRDRALAAMAETELPNPEELYDKYPHELSGGMLQRVMIAAAIISRPKLLIADEPTTALDVTIQAQILALLRKLNQDTGMAILFISHNLQVVRKLCTRVAVMQGGRFVEAGPVEQIFQNPQQAYTKRLIAAIPTRERTLRQEG